MSSTAGGGGGGGGGSGFFGAGADGFFVFAAPLLLFLGFELPGAGFFAAGFDGAGSAARVNGAHATANAAATIRARASEASMGGDSTRPGVAPYKLRWNRVSTVKCGVRSSPGPQPAVAATAGGITRKSSSCTWFTW